MKAVGRKITGPILLSTVLLFSSLAPLSGQASCDGGRVDTAAAPLPVSGFQIGGVCDELTAPEPNIDIEKAVNGADADSPGLAPKVMEGDRLTWTYTVSNTGDVELTDIRVTDKDLGEIECPASELEAGESMTCTAFGVAEVGEFGEEACAVGDYVLLDDRGVMVTTKGDCDKSHYIGTRQAVASVENVPVLELVQ